MTTNLTYLVPRTPTARNDSFGAAARSVAISRQTSLTGSSHDGRLLVGADTAVERMTDLTGNRPWFACPHRPSCPACITPRLWQLTPRAHDHRLADAADIAAEAVSELCDVTVAVERSDDFAMLSPEVRSAYPQGRMRSDDTDDLEPLRRVRDEMNVRLSDPHGPVWTVVDHDAATLIADGPDPTDPGCVSSPDEERVAAVRTLAAWELADVRPAADAAASGVFRDAQEQLVPADLDGANGPDHARRVLTATRDLVEATADDWARRLYRQWPVPTTMQWNAEVFGDLVPELFDRWFADLLAWASPHPQVLRHVAALDDNRARQMVGMLVRTGFAVDAETVTTSPHDATVVLMSLL